MTTQSPPQPGAAADPVAEEFGAILIPDSIPGGPDGDERRRRARRRRRHKRVVAGAAGIAGLIVLLVIWSLVGAYLRPGNENFKAKWIDWLRDHHAGFVVQHLENAYFASKQPPKGGTVTRLHTLPGTETLPHSSGQTSVAGPTTTLPPHSAFPAAVPLVVSPGAPGEGQWKPIGPTIDGLPTMAVAQFRADDVYTSQLASAVWIDTKLLRLRLLAGTQEPGNLGGPHSIEGDALPKIAAAFNGGFRFKDAKGGMYLDGVEAVPLVDGAASLVIHRDGSVEIGAWNREVHMSPDVEAVLQNLTLMVDDGKIDPRVSHNDTSMWGQTLKSSLAVARSGVGVSADGALIYVAGPALTAKSLAESLQRAGAVRAMTLDLNPEWVTFLFFSHLDPADPRLVAGAKLYPQIERPTTRYLSPDSRDFFTISTR